MNAREVVIGELMKSVPPSGSIELLKDGVAFSTRSRRIEYHVHLSKTPGRRVEKLAGFLKGLMALIDEKKFAKGVKHIKFTVVVYDTSFGLKVVKMNRSRTELGEVVFSEVGKNKGSRVWGSGELGNPAFVDFGIDLIEDYLKAIS